MRATNERLKAALSRLNPQSGHFPSAVRGLTLTRWDAAGMTDTCFYAPAVGLIAQGPKEPVIGRETFVYGGLDCLVNGVDMPSDSRILEASPDRPLLAVSLAVDDQFKKVTSLSPLQFQKHLRLYEAQRPMLAENMDAAQAGRAVGYESASQFTREYKRLFGEPPHRDRRRLLQEA